MMRAVVVREFLVGGDLPSGFSGTRIREYPCPLGEDTVITIVELAVAERHAIDAAIALARRLRAGPHCARLINDQSMYIAFPNCLVYLERGNADGERQAQAIGQTFDVPASQMRFLEMFEADRQDKPPRLG